MVLKISTTDTLIYDLHKTIPIFMQFIKSHFMICINDFESDCKSNICEY